MQTLKELKMKIFADGTDIASMKQAYREGIVRRDLRPILR